MLTFIALILLCQNGNSDLPKTALKSTTPSDEIVRLDINNDDKPDILERWWNGKRVRWLDENGDGLYDSALDINIKWAARAAC